MVGRAAVSNVVRPQTKRKQINMKRKTNILKQEKGSLIVEASIVFPVMFFLVVFIIYIGNMYFEQAKIENIVLKNAIYGAESIADPFHEGMSKEKPVITSDPRALNNNPYRYLFGSDDYKNLETEVHNRVVKEIGDVKTIFFKNSTAENFSTELPGGNYAHYDRNFLYSTFTVQVNYEVKIPLRFFFTEDLTIYKLKARAEVMVNDESEFIRNVDMAFDLLSETKVAQAIGDVFTKVNAFIERFGLNDGKKKN